MGKSNDMYALHYIYEKIEAFFDKKAFDYGVSWRSLRPISINDQLLIKVLRLITIQDPDHVQRVDETQEEGFIALFNYSAMAIVNNFLSDENNRIAGDNEIQEALTNYSQVVDGAFELACKKNEDYGSAWKQLSVETITDLIHQKLMRTKQIIKNGGKVLVSEDIDASYFDIMNYSVFALSHLGYGEREDVVKTVTRGYIDERINESIKDESMQKIIDHRREMSDFLHIENMKNIGTVPRNEEYEKQWAELVSNVVDSIEETPPKPELPMTFSISEANKQLEEELLSEQKTFETDQKIDISKQFSDGLKKESVYLESALSDFIVRDDNAEIKADVINRTKYIKLYQGDLFFDNEPLSNTSFESDLIMLGFAKLGSISGFSAKNKPKNVSGKCQLFYKRTYKNNYWVVSIADDLSFFHITRTDLNTYYYTSNILDFKEDLNNRVNNDVSYFIEGIEIEKKNILTVRESILLSTDYFNKNKYVLETNESDINLKYGYDVKSTDSKILNKLIDSDFENLANGSYISDLENGERETNNIKLYFKKHDAGYVIIQVSDNKDEVTSFNLFGNSLQIFNFSKFDLLNYYVDENSPKTFDLSKNLKQSTFFMSNESFRLSVDEIVDNNVSDIPKFLKDLNFKYVGLNRNNHCNYYGRPNVDGSTIVVEVDLLKASEINSPINFFYLKGNSVYKTFAKDMKHLIDSIDYYSSDFKEAFDYEAEEIIKYCGFITKDNEITKTNQFITVTDPISKLIAEFGGFSVAVTTNKYNYLNDGVSRSQSTYTSPIDLPKKEYFVSVSYDSKIFIIERDYSHNNMLKMYRVNTAIESGYDLVTSNIAEMVNLIHNK